MMAFKLPENFKLGSATAATQIEGGDRNNNWYRWCAAGKIKDGSTCFRANDHWNRLEEDIGLMKKLNQKVYRMGLEWSRIEPQKGIFDETAIQHYRKELEMLLQNGITPLVTLHHFSHPLWFCDEGEFENPESVIYFKRYAGYCVERLGDLVSEYITINEPNVYVTFGYLYGTWPPGKKDMKLVIKVYRNMISCHIAAYLTIHEVRKSKGFSGKTMVGVANHLRVFDPYSKNPADQIAAKFTEYMFQGVIVKAMTSGFLLPPLGFGLPYGRGRYCDFLGINYYSRSAIHFKGLQDDVMPGTPVNDLGWEIYPEGLSRLCRKYYKKYKVPIWITENGTCDSADAFRAKYIYSHLLEISKLFNEGIPVERYYHWTIMDNFEWLEGESAAFGLISINFETQKRKIRKSGKFYSEICKNNSVEEWMIEKYL